MGARICVVGAGRWGRNHIRALRELGALGGVVETRAEARAELLDACGGAPVYASLDEALERPFDGYVIATPAETHAALATRTLGLGKATLVEKPLALCAAEGRRLKSLAQARGAPLMVGHLLLFHPAIRTIKRLIDEGKVGKLQYLYSNRLNLGAVRTEENILWSFAPHDISLFQLLVGRTPSEVVARGGAFLQPHIHDSTMMVLTYPGNIVGHIFVSWLHPFKEHRVVVIGSKGMLSYEDSSKERQILFYEKGIDWVRGEPIKRDGPTETIHYDPSPPLMEELRYFIKLASGAERPASVVAGADSAIEALEILEQATSSLLGRGEAPPAPVTDYFAHPTAIIDDNVTIGAGTKIWHYSHVQSGAVIGRNGSFGQNVNVACNVRIGDYVKVQNNVSIYEGVELEDYVFCGPSMVFTNVIDPRCKYPQRGGGHYRRTLVREGASLGANCTIVCGVTIGRHAFIGAGAVVTRDVPDYALMLGSPARRRGWACECGERLKDLRDQDGATASCPRCRRVYQFEGGAVTCVSQEA